MSWVIDGEMCRVKWDNKSSSVEKMLDLKLEQDKFKLKVRMKGQNKVVEADDYVDLDCEQTSRFGRKSRKVNYGEVAEDDDEVVGDFDEVVADVNEVVAGSSGINDGESDGNDGKGRLRRSPRKSKKRVANAPKGKSVKKN